MPELLTDTPAVVRLADLAAPQPGAIVSRVLLKQKSGSLTLFAFGAGEGLTEHTSTSDALIHVLQGALEVELAGEPHRLTAGEAIGLPANVPHAVHAPEDAQMQIGRAHV